MSADARQRAGDRIARLAGQGLDLVGFWRASTEALASAVPHYWAPCWFTLDPASLLVTSHFDEEIPELPPQWLVHEYYQDDVNKLADVARSKRGISTLHEATGRRPEQQPALARQHGPWWGPGADRRAAHPGRGGVGGRWGCTASPGGRCSTSRSWHSSVRWRPTWLRGHAGPC
jgi:hypothetical protein